MIVSDLKELVKQGGFQRIQYRKELDAMYALESEYSTVQLDKERIKLNQLSLLASLQIV